MHRAGKPGQRVPYLVDDTLATSGTVAAIEMIRKDSGCKVVLQNLLSS